MATSIVDAVDDTAFELLDEVIPTIEMFTELPDRTPRMPLWRDKMDVPSECTIVKTIE
jgi:hypothetical protein